MERLAHAIAKNMDMALSVFEISSSAYDLLYRRDPLKQRRLLEILLSNSELAGGELSLTFRKPFSYLACWRDEPNEEDPSRGFSEGVRSKWSGWANDYRTFWVDPGVGWSGMEVARLIADRAS